MAYLYRLASCNNSSFKDLVKKVQDNSLIDGRLNPRYWHLRIDAIEMIAFIGPIEKRPRRWLCPACVKSGLPDLFVPGVNIYMEYCLVHGISPIKACPHCKQPSRYGLGTYLACRCGHEWANSECHKVKEETFRLYRQIAGDVPLGIEPTIVDLERHQLTDITQRLQLTWEFLWTDNMLQAFTSYAASKDRPAFGKRWEVLVEAMGVEQYKLDYWVLHIACWLRSLRMNMADGALKREVPWTYLRCSILASYNKGCSGPRPSECVLVGRLCKTNKQAINGDPLPRLVGTFFRPKPLNFERGGVGAIVDIRPDPFGDEDSESLHELSNGDPKLHVALIELVAMGVIQPLKLTHPTTWRFPKGTLLQVFRQWIEKSGAQEKSWHSTNMDTLGDFCRRSNMGELIYRLFVIKDVHLKKEGKSFWDMQLVNWAFAPQKNLWALEVIHRAVLKSLSMPAKRAAIVAHGYLTSTLADIEIELYCGPPDFLRDLRSSQSNRWDRMEYENPSIEEAVWHRGELVVL